MRFRSAAMATLMILAIMFGFACRSTQETAKTGTKREPIIQCGADGPSYEGFVSHLGGFVTLIDAPGEGGRAGKAQDARGRSRDDVRGLLGAPHYVAWHGSTAESGSKACEWIYVLDGCGYEGRSLYIRDSLHVWFDESGTATRLERKQTEYKRGTNACSDVMNRPAKRK
jgi:hypothetical protein